MLICTMVNDDVLEVKEQIFTFTGVKTSYVYYNIRTKKRSILGKKDEDPSEEVTEKEWDWVKKYYLPKVGK